MWCQHAFTDSLTFQITFLGNVIIAYMEVMLVRHFVEEKVLV